MKTNLKHVTLELPNSSDYRPVTHKAYYSDHSLGPIVTLVTNQYGTHERLVPSTAQKYRRLRGMALAAIEKATPGLRLQ